MRQALPSSSIRTAKQYDDLLNASYLRVKREVVEVVLPPSQVLSVSGTEPPASKPYQEDTAILYGFAYGLKMGLKFRKLARPRGYVDFKVGAFGTFWWSTGDTFEIDNAETLRWRAYLMVPAFVSGSLVSEARALASAKHPEIPYGRASLRSQAEGRCVQVLHVGPYDREQPTIDRLHQYMREPGLAMRGGITRSTSAIRGGPSRRG